MESLLVRRDLERPTRPAPRSLAPTLRLPRELEAVLARCHTRDAFDRISATQQNAYVEWVTEGGNPGIRAMRAMMVSRVVGQLG